MDQYSTQHSTEDALYNPGLNPSRCLAQRNRSTTRTGACVTPLYIGFLEASRTISQSVFLRIGLSIYANILQ